MELVSTKEEKKGEKNQTQIVGYKCIIPRAFSYPHRIVRYFLSRIQNWLVSHVQKNAEAYVAMFFACDLCK
jgi:hypothetical protein